MFFVLAEFPFSAKCCAGASPADCLVSSCTTMVRVCSSSFLAMIHVVDLPEDLCSLPDSSPHNSVLLGFRCARYFPNLYAFAAPASFVSICSVLSQAVGRQLRSPRTTRATRGFLRNCCLLFRVRIVRAMCSWVHMLGTAHVFICFRPCVAQARLPSKLTLPGIIIHRDRHFGRIVPFKIETCIRELRASPH